jgi:[ribosomal protein S18]-alanine N-acetyltransferase
VITVLYRRYQYGDFAQLYAIEEICFHPPVRFSRRYMQQIIGGRTSATWVAEEDGVMAGFTVIDCREELEGNIAYIQTIEVAPAYRRRGMGAELLRRVDETARAAGAVLIWLHVAAENDPAIRLYRAHGYQRQGRQEHYYARGRAAEIYVKSLMG